ncbi:hypothetical protein HCI95_08925 [Listeria booriae]|nr:hypothetical protein [Listeria booriae]MBC6306422.1 hypothetical protein [Listeria booriae]
MNGLVTRSFYSASVSATDGFTEGGKTNVISQKTKIPKIEITKEFIYGETYILGQTIDDPGVVRAPIYDINGVYIATGTVTNGQVKIYVAGNAKIIPGNDYLVGVTDEADPNNKIQSMNVIVNAKIPQITLNPVTTTQKVVAGKTESGIQVKVSQNNVARTVVVADSDGNYTCNLSTCVIGDVIKVETKVGSTYSTSKEYTVVT